MMRLIRCLATALREHFRDIASPSLAFPQSFGAHLSINTELPEVFLLANTRLYSAASVSLAQRGNACADLIIRFMVSGDVDL
jgi:hypothetical protein